MTVQYRKQFLKDLKKLTQKQKNQAYDRLELFQVDPTNVMLRNHKLTGEYQGFSSINITGDFRALYREESEDTVRFFFVRNHNQLYS